MIVDLWRSLGTHIHVLHDQVRGAVVDKSTAGICVAEEWVQLRHQLLLTIVLENYGLVLLDDSKALVKDLLAVLLAHKVSELRELA